MRLLALLLALAAFAPAPVSSEEVCSEERLAVDGVDGDIVFHTDPCERALCPVCDVPDCPVRREAFTGRPPLTVEEARLAEPLASLRQAP